MGSALDGKLVGLVVGWATHKCVHPSGRDAKAPMEGNGVEAKKEQHTPGAHFPKKTQIV